MLWGVFLLVPMITACKSHCGFVSLMVANDCCCLGWNLDHWRNWLLVDVSSGKDCLPQIYHLAMCLELEEHHAGRILFCSVSFLVGSVWYTRWFPRKRNLGWPCVGKLLTEGGNNLLHTASLIFVNSSQNDNVFIVLSHRIGRCSKRKAGKVAMVWIGKKCTCRGAAVIMMVLIKTCPLLLSLIVNLSPRPHVSKWRDTSSAEVFFASTAATWVTKS